MDGGLVSLEEILELNRLLRESMALPSCGGGSGDGRPQFSILRPQHVAHTLGIMLDVHSLLEFLVGSMTLCCDVKTQNMCVMVMNNKQTKRAFEIMCLKFNELWLKARGKFSGLFAGEPYVMPKVTICSNNKILIRPHGGDNEREHRKSMEKLFDGRWNLFPEEKFGPFRSVASQEMALFSPIMRKQNLRCGIVLNPGTVTNLQPEALDTFPVNKLLMMCIAIVKVLGKKSQICRKTCMDAQLGVIQVEDALKMLQKQGIPVFANDEIRVEMWNCVRDILLKQ